MTLTLVVAPGASKSSASEMPNACAIRNVTPTVGLAWPRSIWLSIDRLTPLARASASSDHPRSVRSCFRRRQRCVLIGSGGGLEGILGASAIRTIFSNLPEESSCMLDAVRSIILCDVSNIPERRRGAAKERDESLGEAPGLAGSLARECARTQSRAQRCPHSGSQDRHLPHRPPPLPLRPLGRQHH